jgi:hypothetical protein
MGWLVTLESFAGWWLAPRADLQLELNHAAIAMLVARAVLPQNGEHVGVLGKHLGDKCSESALRRSPFKLGQ